MVIFDPQRKKARVTQDIDTLGKEFTHPILQKLEDVQHTTVARISENLVFVDKSKKALACIVCRLPSNSPVVSSCCQRVVGCGPCLNRWCYANSRCPLCSVSSTSSTRFALKGIDGITGIFRVGDDRKILTNSTSDHSSNEFEELPSFRTNHDL